MELGLLISHGSNGELIKVVNNRQNSLAETQVSCAKWDALYHPVSCKELTDVIRALQEFFGLLDAPEDSKTALDSFISVLNEGSRSYSQDLKLDQNAASHLKNSLNSTD